MDLSEQIDLILLDFSKAFDKVPHERLLYKAQYYELYVLEILEEMLTITV
jgi:hypothetical protein